MRAGEIPDDEIIKIETSGGGRIMTWHITARMAWHDRRWDGKVCDDPAANSYCTGGHSLLSERLAREKRVECETPCAQLDASLPQYQPPCFWTSSAFASEPTRTLHRHPFSKFKDEKAIAVELPPYSGFTWPFRLSMVHHSQRRHGQYFPDLHERIAHFTGRLVKNRSLIFFYLNYDNPVSADDYKYALVGCARLTDFGSGGEFKFSAEELAEVRRDEGMKNFPTMNWALRISHAGPSGSVRLPYHEYLTHINEHPEHEGMLDEIRVLVDEPALLPNCKYVAELMHDDHALMLLYKMKRALTMAQVHSIVEVDDSLDLIEEYIADCWADRGLYPGLGSAMNVLADLAEGEARVEGTAGHALVDAVRGSLHQTDDLLDWMFALVEGSDSLPEALSTHRRTLRDTRAGFRDHKALKPLLRKLALFTLTPRQVARILFPDSDGGHAFGGRSFSPADIVGNPYLLAESYVSATVAGDEEQTDLDREQRTDSAIDYAVIDIGMFPDRRYLEPRDDLQDLTVAGPERLRAFAIEALRAAQAEGHSFVSSAYLAEHAAQHPLFYRDKLAVSEGQLLSYEHLAHFRGRLHVEQVDVVHFFYLQEAYDAEQIIMRYVGERLTHPEHKVDLAWLPAFVTNEAAALGAKIADFESNAFFAERERLMTGAMTQRFYCATGRPGSGKSQAVGALLKRFDELGERTLVLAPTGKAALRLNQEAPEDASREAQTIDRWIYRAGLAEYLAEGADLKCMERSDRFEPVDNIIIDEMSMVNLFYLALVFRAFEVHQPSATKRVILVGDENQLPPIGCGKPFQDIIAHVRGDATLEQRNHVRLTVNCRQKHDATVIKAAHLFVGKNRYYDELFDQLCSGGPISKFLDVRYFANTEELHGKITEFVEATLDEAIPDHRERVREQAFNLLLKLYENGYVPRNAANDLALDRVQLLSPYRGGPSGALGLSEFMRRSYRAEAREAAYKQTKGFVHSDKIVRISNYYAWNRDTKRKELRLSNGSVGVLCNTKRGWKAFFSETEWPLDWAWMDADDFELAYGLTVHKAQGSEFEEVLVVVPERRALLSRELLYTAMTRSKTRLTLLVQKSERGNPLQIARDRSVIARRNSSVFSQPFDAARVFEPESGIKVKSKIEYLIYNALIGARQEGKISFEYESKLELPFGDRTVPIHPDFVIQSGGRTFYWEHLGLIDRQDYARDWRTRYRAYEAAGLKDVLLTTDDLSGVKSDHLAIVLDDIIGGSIKGRADLGFSMHHYTL